MKLSADERRKERRLIMDGAWPHFPLLPVINRDMPDEKFGEFPATGLIAWRMGIEEGPIRVYLSNLYELPGLAEKFQQETGERAKYADVLKDVPVKEYATLDEFFDAGWQGD